jgi:Fe-S-cluster containining protein
VSGKRERKKLERIRRSKLVRKGARSSDRGSAEKLLEGAAEETRQAAERYLRRDDLPDRVVELADSTRQLALRVMQQSPLAGKHECEPGCAGCCHTAVTVAAPEMFAIVKYLEDHYSREELREVRQRMDRNAELASGMTRDEYIAKLIPCALLTDDGNCRAHPVRPIACAGFLSTSRAKCEAELNRVPNREPVPTDKFAMLAGLSVSNGLMDACQRANLDGNFYELHHALRRVMDTPDAAERWARGENVFEGCLR